MMNRLLPLALCALVLSPVSAAATPVTLMAGSPEARHVTLAFAADRTGPEALVIGTRRVGNPGAALRIWIDQSPQPLVDVILGDGDCRFDDAGAARRIVIDGRSGTYARFVHAFRKGRAAHVEVRNAAVMEMRDDLSLIGFTAAYGR